MPLISSRTYPPPLVFDSYPDDTARGTSKQARGHLNRRSGGNREHCLKGRLAVGFLDLGGCGPLFNIKNFERVEGNHFLALQESRLSISRPCHEERFGRACIVVKRMSKTMRRVHDETKPTPRQPKSFDTVSFLRSWTSQQRIVYEWSWELAGVRLTRSA